MKTLTLNLKKPYWEAIKRGEKSNEYRLANPYWTQRLIGRHYDNIKLYLGYPKKDDTSRILWRAWDGVQRDTITHPHFGASPVEVFAIDVSGFLTE